MKKTRSNKWTIKEQTIFLKRLGELLNQGYTFVQASQFLSIQLRKKCQEDVELVLEKCKQGDSLYDIFGAIGFHKDILGYLYFAEKHGDISFALIEGSSMLQKKLQHTEKFKKIVRYPVFLLVFVGFMFMMIEKILLPQFQSLYSSMNYQENILTELLFNLSSLNHSFLLIILFLFVSGLLFYLIYFRRLTSGAKMKMILKIPIIKGLTILLNSHFFSVQLSNLLKGGLSIYQSLSMFEQQNHSQFFKEEAKEMKRLLLAGERFDLIIQTRDFYEKDLAMVISHGQSNGNVAKELHHYSQFILQQIEEKVTKLLTVVQPLLFSMIGIIIMLMYAAIMVPMFQLINGI
ncbi:competence type IV pilus assembly protein ComGB [Fredinandcohnia quinoae]|uniref:Type II secretion system F family protein n=1 Tax=Fredinandcohnia quinoae TaxID=2918902 RepID=A0AAW5DW97_9BACI|nr:competence type IV pilus assembly protein ComGB [Fredinandcohnia sp. SECRCQ15]MCH1624917.1 type II secretion system F family protein [Fredinandcohnia sp. SECRCQ15]